MMNPSTTSPADRLTFTLFLAGVVHAALIFGIHFTKPDPVKIKKSLAVTLVQTPSRKAPQRADFLAQENQQGGGENLRKTKPRSVPVRQDGEIEPPAPPKPEPRPLPTPEPQPRQAQEERPKVLTQQQSIAKIAAAEDTGAQEEKRPFDVSALSRQIAEIGADFSRTPDTSANRPRIKYINSVNAQKYMAAAYERAWQDKVERIGNLNYPEDARRQKLSGTLVLSVGLNEDGTIYSIEVRRSSGHPLLDDAATRIVRLGAPYAQFPEALAREADVLVITRTWKFTSNALMSTR